MITICELFGISANRRIEVNTYLKEFFNHSISNPNGWGMAVLDNENISIEREPLRAKDSMYLKNRLSAKVKTSRLMAHIRKATVGHVNFSNTHPFIKRDESGRTWVLVHNGTIFDAPHMNHYRFIQEGETDSERILFYLVNEINKGLEENFGSFDTNERFLVIDKMVRDLSKGNKLNLMIYDGDYFYVHKNQHETLYYKEEKGATYFSTSPLDDTEWTEFPLNQLNIYKNGQLVYTGTKHNNTYYYNEDDYKYQYLDYAEM